jgi:hypothetical protein
MVGGRMFWIIAIGSLGLMAAAACGSSRATTTRQATGVAAPVSMATGAAAPVSTTPSPATTPHPVDVAGARQAALGLFVADPSTPGHWYACSNADNWAACPLPPTVKARLANLTSSGYFSDGPGGCGEEYISGTQNGLWNAPKALSAVGGANGSVTVVIQRGPSPPPNLTAVMTIENGTWLASDLASGTGAAASIFSAKPNC